jgi:hypothetical protein
MEVPMSAVVEIGQHWRDNDKRMGGRILVVTNFELNREGTQRRAVCLIGATGKYTRISVSRLLTGCVFTMVRDADGRRLPEQGSFAQ